MKNNAVAKMLANKLGLRKKGAFYIGTCNDSVIAGYGLDTAPSATYVWRFALPSYDHVEFLHFSLGKRIWTIPGKSDAAKADVELFDFLQRDWSAFSKVSDCKSLIEYIGAEKLEGTYALWAGYLTHIWCKEFDAAEQLLDDAGTAKRFLELQAISKHFLALSEARNERGWEGCLTLLREWHVKTKTMYCQ